MTIVLPRRAPRIRHRFAAASLCAGLLSVAPAFAQGQPSTEPGPPTSPVQIAVLLADGNGMRCTPATVPLPASTSINLELVNRSNGSMRFVAQQFFAQSKVSGAAATVPTKAGDGVLVAPGVTSRIVLQTPGPGQYPFACSLVDATVPDPRTAQGVFAVK